MQVALYQSLWLCYMGGHLERAHSAVEMQVWAGTHWAGEINCKGQMDLKSRERKRELLVTLRHRWLRGQREVYFTPCEREKRVSAGAVIHFKPLRPMGTWLEWHFHLTQALSLHHNKVWSIGKLTNELLHPWLHRQWLGHFIYSTRAIHS